MIYWFTGQPGHGKTVLCNLLKDYIQYNYQKNVIHIDGDDIREIFDNKDYSREGRIKNITFAQNLAHFCNKKGFDVVVSVVSPYKDVRESFKEKMGDEIVEFYVHANVERGREHFHVADYEPPTDRFIEIDTTFETPQESLNYITSGIGI
jgi:adenylylsulfate kinase-like enzyme